MKTIKKGLMLVVMLQGCGIWGEANAQPGMRPRRPQYVAVVSHPRPVMRYPRRRVVVVHPRPVRTCRQLPGGHVTVYAGRVPYYYHDGFYYRPYRGTYRLVVPRYGIRVRVLPPHSRRIVWGTSTYFYAQGVFYVERGGTFEVTAPAQGVVVPELPAEAETVNFEQETYYAFGDVLYKPVTTEHGIAYEVAGEMEADTQTL